MNQGFYTGINGMQSTQYGIDVISDNLANVNSIGYRGSQTEFASLFEKNLTAAAANGPTEDTFGVGSRVQATSMMEQMGTLIQGDRTTDLAIDGEGWFGISGMNEIYYTRAGDFTFDSNRDLVTQDGFHALGTLGTNFADDVLTEPLESIPLGDVVAQGPLNFPLEMTYPVQPTTQAQFFGDLGVDDIPVGVSATAISPNSAHNRIRLDFTQSATQPPSGTAWDIVGTVTNNDGTITYDTQTGSALFNEIGAMVNYTMPSLDNDGAPVAIDLGTGFNGVMSTGSDATAALSSSSDGHEGGELVGYTINQNADVIAAFSNGRSSAVGKMAVFHFQNDQGLERTSGTRFQESENSGDPIFYTDANGNPINGTAILTGMLENSNVRLEVGLTELIIMQRSYDANAKSITTSDELIQKALQM